jgi:hypothetical protein
MFSAMCSSPACSQPALSTVHQRPNWNTGIAPLAPNRNSTGVLGASADMMLSTRIPPPDISSVITHSVTQAPTTSCANPKSAPRLRSIGPNPQSPGFDRPQV